MAPLDTTTTFIEAQETRTRFHEAIEKLERNLSKVELAVCYPNQTYLQRDSYQLIAKLLEPSNAWERMLYAELMQACFQLEIKSHGSSALFLRAFLGFAEELLKDGTLAREMLVPGGVEHYQEGVGRGALYLRNIQQETFPATSTYIDELVWRVCQGNSVAATTVREAIKLAGLEGNIVVEEHNGKAVVVELKFGYNFKVRGFSGLIPQFGSWSASETKVLLIDGIVEKVSELDRVLNGCYRLKLPLVIVAQGFSEEVLATVHANNSRGNFDVQLVRLEQSLDTINMLGDIAAVCDSEVVSVLKGDSLTVITLDSLASVEKVTLTKDVLSIQNMKSRPRVMSHLKYLEERRREQAENTEVSDLADLTTKRIQNLLAHVVTVSLPSSSANTLRSFIDGSLRACRGAYTYGLCKPSDKLLERLEPMWQRAHRRMVSGLKEGEVVCGIGLYLAAVYAESISRAYFTAAGAVVREDADCP